MKLKKLRLTNFAKFSDFECEYNGNVTRLVGINGSGKTTVGITALWACLKGIAEKSGSGQLMGERFRFIGGSKPTADIEITLVDEVKNIEVKVKNHISKSSNNITFEAPDGYEVSDDWLKNLLSVAFLSAKNFCSLDPKEQSILLGIDTSKYDSELSELKTQYTLINSQVKSFGEIVEVEPVEKVSFSELMVEKQKIDAHNTEQKEKQDQNEKVKSILTDLEQEKMSLEERLKEVNKNISDCKSRISSHKEPEFIDTSEIIAKMENAQEINEKANAYQNYLVKKESYDKMIKQRVENKEKQKQKEKEKIDYIKSFDFPFKGMSVDDKGGLLLNDRPIKEPYFSKGERELIVAKLYASKNPELKIRFIDDFELLDDDNQKKLIDSLSKEGFQIITAEVGNKAVKDNTLLLRDCEVVNSYDENNQEELI